MSSPNTSTCQQLERGMWMPHLPVVWELCWCFLQNSCSNFGLRMLMGATLLVAREAVIRHSEARNHKCFPCRTGINGRQSPWRPKAEEIAAVERGRGDRKRFESKGPNLLNVDRSGLDVLLRNLVTTLFDSSTVRCRPRPSNLDGHIEVLEAAQQVVTGPSESTLSAGHGHRAPGHC